jgi:hypothetical protein
MTGSLSKLGYDSTRETNLPAFITRIAPLGYNVYSSI